MQPNDPNYWNPGEQDELATQQSSPVEPEPQDPEAISWQASEHLQHNNGTGWYIGFFIIAAVLVGFAIFFRAWSFIPVVLVMAVAGIIYVRRPPRVLHYRLSDKGLEIDGNLHPYSSYKSFGVIRDGAVFAILLMPVRRFAQSTIIYFDEADGEAIVDEFGARLPMENHELDPLERFLRLIRF